MPLFFNKETRCLGSLKTRHLKRKDGTLISDHPIYLGVNDDPDNYEEITKKEYNELLKEQEAQENAND